MHYFLHFLPFIKRVTAIEVGQLCFGTQLLHDKSNLTTVYCQNAHAMIFNLKTGFRDCCNHTVTPLIGNYGLFVGGLLSHIGLLTD